ncbi:HlyD family secretion protein [Aliivibrio salmonicida]|uniref:HlyD family secretion protein n=1 Tax=Aliivibrio salmonicida TaxID=40269 RepID=UPI0002F57505|nr:efflux RND transporter periplasmic adaptor subunit [Aliivibrio salmonicida]
MELNHGDNAAMKIALDNVASARLDLSNTDIQSTIDGVVTNLQLQKGSYINMGTPSLFVVNDKAEWISADFNEKGVSHLKTGNTTYVVFDALPGHVFDGKIISKDSAIFDVYNPTNQLASVENDDRWIRNQQKIRTRIAVDKMNNDLISGSRATVMVANGNPIIDAVGIAWMHFVSLFRYVY